jgi:4-hydroxy-tetrahydrodipicolinate synthase
MGMSMGDPRPPRLPLPAAEVPKLAAVMQAMGLLSQGVRVAAE